MVIGYALDKFRVALGFPFPLKGGLTVGTGTVVAGNGVDHLVPTFFTDADVISELAGLTFHDAFGSLALFCIKAWMGFKEGIIKAPERIADRIFSLFSHHKDSSHSFRYRCRVSGIQWWRKGIYVP